MSKYAEDEQYAKYLTKHPLSKAYPPQTPKIIDPFKSINYNNNKNPYYKNVNTWQMDTGRFSITTIKEKINEGIKKINPKKNTGKKDECLMITCNNKVCFC